MSGWRNPKDPLAIPKAIRLRERAATLKSKADALLREADALVSEAEDIEKSDEIENMNQAVARTIRDAANG